MLLGLTSKQNLHFILLLDLRFLTISLFKFLYFSSVTNIQQSFLVILVSG